MQVKVDMTSAITHNAWYWYSCNRKRWAPNSLHPRCPTVKSVGCHHYSDHNTRQWEYQWLIIHVKLTQSETHRETEPLSSKVVHLWLANPTRQQRHTVDSHISSEANEKHHPYIDIYKQI